MDRFLYEAEKRCEEYGRENKTYRARIEGAIETLRDALDEEARIEERDPRLGFDLIGVLHVTERNRDSLRRDNERLRDVMDKVASDLRSPGDLTKEDKSSGRGSRACRTH